MSRDRQICDNIGLVHACARRFVGRGIEYEDLFQTGCMGLIKAVDGFEQERGLKFSTYAVPVILGEIRRLFRDTGAVKVSRSLKELALKMGRERERILKEEGREVAISELAATFGVDAQQAALALGAALPPLSLTRAGEEATEGEEIEVPVDAPDEQITDRLALQQLIGELEPNDRALIVLRYLKRHTQQFTAEQLNMSQVQVSRRERVLLEQMRKKLIG